MFPLFGWSLDCDVCPARSVGLVRYPTTLVPVSGNRAVNTQCADNARRISSTLSVTCTSSGTWSGVPQCQCNTGYREVTVSGRQICQGVLAEKFLQITLLRRKMSNVSNTNALCSVAVQPTICEAKSEGLVRYPTTLAPVSGSVTVTTQCADNAQRTSSSLSVTCRSDGSWSGSTPQCQCNTGYRPATINGRQICQTERKYN